MPSVVSKARGLNRSPRHGEVEQRTMAADGTANYRASLPTGQQTVVGHSPAPSCAMHKPFVCLH